jgi:hypothetical protein
MEKEAEPIARADAARRPISALTSGGDMPAPRGDRRHQSWVRALRSFAPVLCAARWMKERDRRAVGAARARLCPPPLLARRVTLRHKCRGPIHCVKIRFPGLDGAAGQSIRSFARREELLPRERFGRTGTTIGGTSRRRHRLAVRCAVLYRCCWRSPL